MAQSIFNSTWRPDPEIYSPTRTPDVIELANGFYDCQPCRPKYKIKADGHDQPISENSYYDTLSIALVADRTLTKIAEKSGKTVAESEIIVSEGGSKMTERQLLSFIAPRLVEMTTHSIRISVGSNGSHMMSGTWRMTDSDVSSHAEDTIFKVRGQTLEMSDRMGRDPLQPGWLERKRPTMAARSSAACR